jgi:hypothetical protein
MLPLAFVLLSLSWPCERPLQASGKASTAAPVARTLRFGRGGGIAANVTTYTLSSTGQLTRHTVLLRDTTRPAEKLPPVSRAKALACFRRLDALPADSLQFVHPGNVYQFLESRTAAGKPVRIVWGQPGTKAPRQASRLYAELQALLPR